MPGSPDNGDHAETLPLRAYLAEKGDEEEPAEEIEFDEDADLDEELFDEEDDDIDFNEDDQPPEANEEFE